MSRWATPIRPRVSENEVRHVYGLEIGSRFPFTAPLPVGTGAPVLNFEPADSEEISSVEGDFDKVYSSARLDRRGRNLFEFWSKSDAALLRFTGSADFLVFPDSIRWWPAASRFFEIEALFLSSVLAYWLERSGVLALHASAVIVEDRAVAFLGDSGSGKSWAAMAMLLSGFSLLSDDILPVEVAGDLIRCRRGYPQIKTDESIGRYALGDAFETRPLIEPGRHKRGLLVGDGGFGSFHTCDAPLGCLYTVVRDPTGSLNQPRIKPLSRREALLELIRFSFVPRLVEGLGWQSRRLDQLALLTERVPVRQLTVPSGLAHVDSIAPAIAEDSRD